jgi:hypothetical protein
VTDAEYIKTRVTNIDAQLLALRIMAELRTVSPGIVEIEDGLNKIIAGAAYAGAVSEACMRDFGRGIWKATVVDQLTAFMRGEQGDDEGTI